MPKSITFTPQVELRITCDADGTPQRGDLVYRGTNGYTELATIGGTGSDVLFSSLGTAGERSGFKNVVAAAIAAGKAKIGDV